MSSILPALAFDVPSEPLVLSAARTLAGLIATGQCLSRRQVSAVLSEQFGGSDADGRWSVRDAHAALELAQVLWLRSNGGLGLDAEPKAAAEFFDLLDQAIPTQTNRSEEQIEWQQFATPPRIAWLAARACAFAPNELVLEPSAGTGMLALWAARARTRLAINEISPLRRDCLRVLFPEARISGHDGELIDELLPSTITPSVVLMNPPYSHGLERGHDSRTGVRHLRSAWTRLQSGGRIVAIMPEWFDTRRFLASLAGPATLRFNAAIERGFVKQGTSIATRLLVLDKVEAGEEPVFATNASFSELAAMIDAFAARSDDDPVPSAASLPVRSPFKLVTAAHRPLPIPARRAAVPVVVEPLNYAPLETAAPLAEQVGHYLPYRPSRVIIEQAAKHPTPLVESVAMGSIAAPIPTGNPQLPGGLIAKGVLSAAQAETLIYAANAHGQDLPGRFEPDDRGCSLKASAKGHSYRQGYFLGDGTGAGKGR